MKVIVKQQACKIKLQHNHQNLILKMPMICIIILRYFFFRQYIINMFEQVTTKKLMKNSMCFQVTCLIFIITVIGGITETIVYSTNDCGWTKTYYYSCSDFYYQKPYECTNGGAKYCCSSSKSYCGDSNCWSKAYDYKTYRISQSCDGHLIGTWFMFFLSSVAFFVIILKFKQFIGRAAEQNFMNGLRLQAVNNSQPVPLIYVPNQPPVQNHIINLEQNWIEEGMLR